MFTKGFTPWNKGKKGVMPIPWNKGTKGVMKANSGSFKQGDKFWLGKKRSLGDRKKMGEAQKRNPVRYWTGKHREDMLGKKHPNWKGGITPKNDKVRHSLEMKLWRKSIWIRDNFTCQKCQKKGGYLVAHHINNFAEFPELRFAIDNGITFCEKCHRTFHKKYGNKNNTKEQLLEFLIRK